MKPILTVGFPYYSYLMIAIVHFFQNFAKKDFETFRILISRDNYV